MPPPPNTPQGMVKGDNAESPQETRTKRGKKGREKSKDPEATEKQLDTAMDTYWEKQDGSGEANGMAEEEGAVEPGSGTAVTDSK